MSAAAAADMGLMWQFTHGVFSASASAQRTMASSLTQANARRAANRGARSARRGLIGPWDPPPPPSLGGYLDYSGVAMPGDITNGSDFPVGRYVRPKHPWRGREELALTAEAVNGHTAVLGPTTSGKTASIIAPWIYAGMRAGHLVVAVDVKGNRDLEAHVARYAATQPPMDPVPFARFDYNDPSGSVSWNWIAEVKDESAVNAAAEALCGRDRENDPNREFRLRDLKWMRGLLELLNTTGAPWNVLSVLELLDDQGRLQHLVERQAGSRAAIRLGDLAFLDPPDYARAAQFLTTYLELLNITGFVQVTRREQMTMSDLDTAGGLFIVNAPFSDGRLAEATSGLFLSQFLNRRLAQFNSDPRPCLLVLDEAPRLKDRIDLPSLMSLAAGADVSVLLAVQEVNNFREDERDVIFANCANQVLMPRCGPKTTEYFGARLGTRVAVRQSQSSSFTVREGRTWQAAHQTVEVPVLGHAEMANPPGGEYGAIMHSYSLSRKPVLVDLTRSDL